MIAVFTGIADMEGCKAVAGTITVEGLEISGKLNPYRSSYSVEQRSSWNQSYTKEAGDNRLLNSRSS